MSPLPFLASRLHTLGSAFDSWKPLSVRVAASVVRQLAPEDLPV